MVHVSQKFVTLECLPYCWKKYLNKITLFIKKIDLLKFQFFSINNVFDYHF